MREIRLMGGNMLNDKMRAIAETIEEVIIHTLPVEYQLFVFEGKITLEDIVGQVLVECSKYAYDTTAEKHSLNYYLKNIETTIGMEDSERMTRKRTMDYIQERRTIEYEAFLNRGLPLDGLKAPNMKNIEDRLAGYNINSFQFWEINNVHDMQLLKAIVERRISKKNFTNDMFIDCAAEYDSTLIKFSKVWNSSDENVLFDFLTMFTLEWKYSFDFFYELANEMIKYNVNEIPDMERRIVAFCGNPAINSLLLQIDPRMVGGTIHIDSRMLVSRRKYIHDIVTVPEEEFEKDLIRFLESLVVVASMLKNMTYRNIPIRKWFIQNSTPDDWATVFRDYDTYQAFVPDKNWTDKKKIRYVKDMYNKTSFDYKNPKNRS